MCVTNALLFSRSGYQNSNRRQTSGRSDKEVDRKRVAKKTSRHYYYFDVNKSNYSSKSLVFCSSCHFRRSTLVYLSGFRNGNHKVASLDR